ncbi:MAG: chromosomal replication initiator protein DnaA [bacterium]
MTEELKTWEKIQEKLAEALGTPAYESWIKPVKFNSLDENNLIISTNSNIAKEKIYKNYLDLINKVLKEVTEKNIKLKIKVEKFENIQQKLNFPELSDLKPEKKPRELKEPKQNKNIPLSENQIDALKSISNNLNLKYTFDTFVVGSHDKFAHAAAFAVAKSPGRAHNPLFIYGSSGLGKTHLMQAIGHYVLVNHPDLKIKYLSTESFTNELINSIRTDKMPAFRSKYRQMDVLLLDDIQFIEGKENTQEEIFHTFNTLYESGKQIIITSDRPPKNIPTLTERLRSRFEWGLLADIQIPDIETRIAILKNKVERENLNVPDDVLEIIAIAYQNNIRELEGGLNRVIAYVSINDCPMTVESVKKIMNFSGSGKNLTLDKIIEITANHFSMESADIKGQSRAKEFSYVRQIAIYLSRNLTNSSFPSIGNAFGGRKHTTILYAYEKMKEEIQTNKILSETVNEISNKITS